MKASILALCLLLALTACSSNDDDPQPTNYKALVENATWSGIFKYTARGVIQPFSLHFFADGTFIWYEFQGEFTGSYQVDNNAGTVTLQFSQSGSRATAAIGTDGQPGSFTYAQNSWEITHANLVQLSSQPLNGVEWHCVGASPLEWTSSFVNETTLVFTGSDYGTIAIKYARKQNTIRMDFPKGSLLENHFIVLTSDSTLLGYRRREGPDDTWMNGYTGTRKK